MNTLKNILLSVALFCGLQNILAQTENSIISTIQKEVDRNKAGLQLEGMAPPFFISYTVVDMYDYRLTATLGSIGSFSESHVRRGIPRLLVGDYMRNAGAGRPNTSSVYPANTSLDDNSRIAITIWRTLDDLYKNLVEQYNSKMATLQQRTQTKEETELPDFEKIAPVNMILKSVPVKFDKTYWENYLRKVSETAKQYPDIINSNLTLNVRNYTSYTYNTEGSRYAVPYTLYQLVFSASTRTVDGQDITHSIYLENATFEQIPDVVNYSNQCKALMEELLKLKNAPVLKEVYRGPVLFEGRAVNEIFRQAFFANDKMCAAPKPVVQPNANRSIGEPQEGGNDFELMLGKRVISRNLTMKSITGQEFYKGQRLNGYYPVDAEGVVPEKELTLIENGILRNMLNGRRPTQKIQNSNGHVRYHYNTSSWKVLPGNILITCNQTFSKEELRKKLLDAAREEGLEYAYIVRRYSPLGGFLNYKIYVADGREELVRCATVSDPTNIKSFERILGASDQELIVSFDDIQSSYICPDALLFEELDVIRTTNIEFKKPYIVPKPN